ALYYWLPKMTGRMMNLSRSTWGSFHNGGMGNQKWVVVVNREGVGCAVVFSGTTAADEWPATGRLHRFRRWPGALQRAGKDNRRPGIERRHVCTDHIIAWKVRHN